MSAGPRPLRCGALVLLLARRPLARTSPATATSRSGPRRAGTGRWDIAVRDLDHALALDANGDGAMTWGELRGARARRRRVRAGRLALASDGRGLRGRVGALAAVEHSDGAYLLLPLAFGARAAPRALTVDYRLFFERGSAAPRDRARSTTAAIARWCWGRAMAARTPRGAAPRRAVVPGFVVQGVAAHLGRARPRAVPDRALAAVGAAPRARRAGSRCPQIRPALADVARIVTAFTAAHSLTLSLAALGLVSVPARLVEPAIAASVLLAAVNNVRPVFGADRWVVAFALGLLARVRVLVGAGRRGPARAGRWRARWSASTLGVELGQLAIVALFVPPPSCFGAPPATAASPWSAARSPSPPSPLVWIVATNHHRLRSLMRTPSSPRSRLSSLPATARPLRPSRAAIDSEPARLPLGERLAREAHARPRGHARASKRCWRRWRAAASRSTDSKQVLASTVGAAYCTVGATAGAVRGRLRVPGRGRRAAAGWSTRTAPSIA